VGGGHAGWAALMEGWQGTESRPACPGNLLGSATVSPEELG
jgi:hypothetical protein